MSDATKQIATEHDRRHNHYDAQSVDRCKNCSAFISEPEIENGKARYYCEKCERWILEYLPTA